MPLQNVTMNDDGEIRAKDISQSEIWVKCVGRKVVKAALLKATEDPMPMGLRLEFESTHGVEIVNLGDEL